MSGRNKKANIKKNKTNDADVVEEVAIEESTKKIRACKTKESTSEKVSKTSSKTHSEGSKNNDKESEESAVSDNEGKSKKKPQTKGKGTKGVKDETEVICIKYDIPDIKHPLHFALNGTFGNAALKNSMVTSLIRQ